VKAAFQAVVLAAGMGKRMNSDLPKVLHAALGRPLLHHVLDRLLPLAPASVVLVVGHKEELVRAACAGLAVRFVTQRPQRGTGHAVQVAWPEIASGPERVLVLAGDMPLVRTDTLRRLLERHVREGNGATFLSGVLAEPGGYGRVIRDDRGAFAKIVEEKDATPAERAVAEVNSGIYCFERDPLREALDSLRSDNKQQEYYLTDTLAFLRGKGRTVGIEPAAHASELMGVNTAAQLAASAHGAPGAVPLLQAGEGSPLGQEPGPGRLAVGGRHVEPLPV
jgi:bifunctional UDP-N-acetylglucosamine pyrophosphorylase/glucosamine-1-phosphate N-acetyltransferase